MFQDFYVQTHIGTAWILHAPVCCWWKGREVMWNGNIKRCDMATYFLSIFWSVHNHVTCENDTTAKLSKHTCRFLCLLELSLWVMSTQYPCFRFKNRKIFYTSLQSAHSIFKVVLKGWSLQGLSMGITQYPATVKLYDSMSLLYNIASKQKNFIYWISFFFFN